MASASLPRTMLQRATRSMSVAAGPSASQAIRCVCQTSRRALHSAPTITQEPPAVAEASTSSSAAAPSTEGILDMWGVKDSKKKASKNSKVAVKTSGSESSTSSAEVASASTSIKRTKDGSKTSPSTYPPFSFANAPREKISTLPGEKLKVCTVKLSCFAADLENLVFFARFVEHVAAAFGMPYHRARPLPVKTSLRTVPRSPFVHKPAQENFVKKVHARSIDIYNSDMDVVKQFIEYIGENGMSNVRMQVRLYERKELGFGKNMLELEAGDLEKTDEEKVKEIAQGILDSGFAGSEDGQASTGDIKVGQAKEPKHVEVKAEQPAV